ncbi:sensor histidine kinase [Paenibacillus solisilvae]|uniref:histidine kinase n=1 Tax=Paenibacillus solisilvae TaxID=2486751 RepID=A0ABW0W8Z0_9BACL
MFLGRRFIQWGSKFSDSPMERKLLIVFILLVTLPLTFIGAVSYRNYSDSIEQNTVSYSTNSLTSMMERVDDYIEDMVRISSVPAYQEELKTYLSRSNTYYEQRSQVTNGDESMIGPSDLDLLSIQRGIQGNILFINNIKRGENSVYIFDKFGNGYYSPEAGAIRLDIQDSYKLWKAKVENSSGEALLLSTQKYMTSLKSERYVFTIVRKIYDTALNDIGMIAVDANISVIEDQITKLDKVTHGKSFIIDAGGNVIYNSDKKLLAANISDRQMVKEATDKNGSFYLTEDGEKYLYIYTSSPNTDWKVFISIPAGELTRNSVVIRNVTWIATFLTIGIAMLISIFFSFALTKPLRAMMRLMRRVQEGDFSVQFPVKRRDEIGQLGSQFNHMILRIDHLIQDIYLMQTKKKKAEMHALQSQINPHFMYNTLEAIRMSAELNDDMNTADMLSILGRLLRYSIGDLQEEVTLNKEIGHMRSFIDLLNYRYPDRFELFIDVPEELKHYSTIKLILQPIVENSIYHGMDDNKPKMRIAIAADQLKGFVRIRVSDDGLGMNEETLDRLNGILNGSVQHQPDGQRGGIGLRNVNERIMLHYGSAYGLKVSSIPGNGTVVTFLLPLEEEISYD